MEFPSLIESKAQANGQNVETGVGGRAFIGFPSLPLGVLTAQAFIEGWNYKELPRLKHWSIACATSSSSWVDSDSLGYVLHKSGVHSCSGTMSGAKMQDELIEDVLDEVTLEKTGSRENPDLAIETIFAGNNNALRNVTGKQLSISLWPYRSSTANRGWFFPKALITSFNMMYDIDTGQAVEWNVDFVASGVFKRPQEDLSLELYGLHEVEDTLGIDL